MNADRCSGATGARWPCYLPNPSVSSSYAGEAAGRSPACWLATPCSPASCTTCIVCRQSFVDVTATESSSHTGLLQPAAATAPADNIGKEINDTG